MAKSTFQNNGGYPSPELDNGQQSDELLLAGKLPKNTVRGGTYVPDFDLRVSYDGGKTILSAPVIKVGGNPSDAVFRELTDQRSNDWIEKIGNTLVDQQRGRWSLTELSVNAGGSYNGASIGFSGKLGFGPDEKMIDYAQSAYDVYRNYYIAGWAKDGIERGGITYQVKDGQKIHYTVEDLQQIKDQAIKNVNEAWGRDNRRADGSIPDNPDQIIASLKESKLGQAAIADASTLVPGNDRLNKQYQQALQGVNGDPNVAAVAVDTISKSSNYKPDQDISVTQGKNGLIVSQGQGDAALNLQVPQAKQGDFERISAQMVQPQQIAMQPDQPQQERKGPSMA